MIIQQDPPKIIYVRCRKLYIHPRWRSNMVKRSSNTQSLDSNIHEDRSEQSCNQVDEKKLCENCDVKSTRIKTIAINLLFYFQSLPSWFSRSVLVTAKTVFLRTWIGPGTWMILQAVLIRSYKFNKLPVNYEPIIGKTFLTTSRPRYSVQNLWRGMVATKLSCQEISIDGFLWTLDGAETTTVALIHSWPFYKN